MAVFKKGSFSVNLGIVSVGADVDDDDRQVAWRLYAQMVTRVAVRGKLDAEGRDSFSGEILVESLESLHEFFREARELMASYPVGSFGQREKDHLGNFVARMLEVVLRPFLEKWQAYLRAWWQRESHRDNSAGVFPHHVQNRLPGLAELLADWSALRAFMRSAAKELAEAYGFLDVRTALPENLAQLWLAESREVAEWK